MKKVISVLLTALMLLGAFSFSAFAAVTVGDVDANGSITAGDARLALRAAVYLESFTGAKFNRADADADGRITASDARLILRAAVQLAEVSSDGTKIVDKRNPSRAFRDFVIANGVLLNEERSWYGYVVSDTMQDGTEIDYVIGYDPTDSARPFCVASFYEYNGYTYETQIWFDDGFSDYLARFLIHDYETEYYFARYTLNHTAISKNNLNNVTTRLSYEGEYANDASLRADVDSAIGLRCYDALVAALNIMYYKGVDVNYMDMHLTHIAD